MGYEELKRRALMPEPERKRKWCTCCGYTCPKPSEDEIPGMFTPLADKQMFQVAPRLELMWPDGQQLSRICLSHLQAFKRLQSFSFFLILSFAQTTLNMQPDRAD